MSYYPQYPDRSDDGHDSPPQGSNDGERRTSPHSRLPSSVQVAGVPRTSRSISSTRTSVPNQAQPIDTFGVGQNWESDPRHVSYTPAQQYRSSFGGQYNSFSPPDQSHLQLVEQHFQPPDHPPPHASQHQGTHYSMPQQHSVPHNEPYPVRSQSAQYPQFSYESGSHKQSWGIQQPSSQYPQQQTWRLATASSTPPQPSPPQYSHQMQPFSNQPRSHQIQHFSNQPHSHQIRLISNDPRQSQPPSRYPGSDNWSSIAGESLPINDPGLNYQAGSPPSRSAPVGGFVCCLRCHTTYQAQGRSATQYDTEPVNLVGSGPLPPCPICGHIQAR